MIIADNICRIDLQINHMIKTSSNKLIPTPEISEMSLLYDKSVISTSEVEQLIKNDMFRNDNRILVLPSKEADKLKTVFKII